MTRLTKALAAAALVLSLVTGTNAAAADRGAKGQEEGSARVGAGAPDQNRAGAGWRASDLMSAKVYGRGQEPIGEVNNVIVDRRGTVKALIIEAGTDGDLSPNLFRVPWSEVRVGSAHDRVTLPIDADSVASRTDFVDEKLDKPLDAGDNRFTELTGTFVTLKDGSRYGTVEDLVFSPEGRLTAVLAREGPDSSLNSAPATDAVFDRHAGGWKLPFSREDITVLQQSEGGGG